MHFLVEVLPYGQYMCTVANMLTLLGKLNIFRVTTANSILFYTSVIYGFSLMGPPLPHVTAFVKNYNKSET